MKRHDCSFFFHKFLQQQQNEICDEERMSWFQDTVQWKDMIAHISFYNNNFALTRENEQRKSKIFLKVIFEILKNPT